MNYLHVLLIMVIFFINSFLINLPALAEVKHNKISIEFIKRMEKPKLILYSDEINEKKIDYPPKVIYSVNNYFYNPFATTVGIPSTYEILPGNRYLICQTHYASGGSGSMANLYLLDLKEPRAWHLSSIETIAGNYPDYSFSPDNKYMVFYDPQISGPFILMGINRENTPYVSEVFTRTQLEKLFRKKFNKKYEIENIKVEWNNNNFEITVSDYSENDKYENHKLIFDVKQKKITEFSPFFKKKYSYNWEKLHINKDQFEFEKENILTPDEKFAKVYFYIDSVSSPVKRQYFLQILRMSDYKIIYEYTNTRTLEDNSGNEISDIFYFKWLNNRIAVLRISGEDTYILNINDSEDKVKAIKNNDIEYINSNNLSSDAKFALYSIQKNPNNEKGGEILKIIRMADNKTVFSADIFNTSYPAVSFQWINNNQAIFFDKSGRTHILKINNNGDLIEDSLINNLPALSQKESINRNILSNTVSSTICIISNNNLYWIDLKKLQVVKITDFNFKFKYSKFGDVEFSETRPQVSLPYITPDGKRIFYTLLLNDYNGKLMSIKLKK